MSFSSQTRAIDSDDSSPISVDPLTPPVVALDMVQLIMKRRQHIPHSDTELHVMIREFTAGRIPDYQMAAWLMAVCCGGDIVGGALTPREIATLTQCLVESGQQLQWPTPPHESNQRCVYMDKHSTGGVGDKVSIVLAPLLVACGQEQQADSDDNSLVLRIPMLAGRGLGHTGGTIDKLESIPGFQTNLTVDAFQRQVTSRVGCCIAAASADLVCPADAKLYALRDVTGTVSSVALQTASIMSKKIAERPSALLLDCKYGLGSFQDSQAQAQILAQSMVSTGEANGIVPTLALLTRMDSPLGTAVGNWLEIVECIEIMQGNFYKRRHLVTLIVMQAAYMMHQSNLFSNKSVDELALVAMDHLVSGKALERFRELVVAQGGDVSVIDNPQSYPHSTRYSSSLVARQNGFIANLDALVFGQVAVQLGAGRMIVNEPVDPCAGIWLVCEVGDSVKAGDILAQVHTNRDGILEMELERLGDAITYSAEPVTPPAVVSHVVTSQHGTQEVTLPSALGECFQLFDRLEN